jgi:hypothetical protein
MASPAEGAAPYVLARRVEGLDPNMDPSRNEPIAILFANQAPDAFQTAVAYGRFFDRLLTAEHFAPPATRGYLASQTARPALHWIDRQTMGQTHGLITP